MVIAEKYELLETVHEGHVKTYRARHRTLGHPLMVHFIEGGDGENVRLLEKLPRLPEAQRNLFIDAGGHGTMSYLVSRPLPDFHNLQSWLDRTALPPAVKGAAPKGNSPSRATASASPAEFTRMFFAELKADAPPEPKKESAGEFTSLFGGSSESAPSLAESHPSPVRQQPVPADHLDLSPEDERKAVPSSGVKKPASDLTEFFGVHSRPRNVEDLSIPPPAGPSIPASSSRNAAPTGGASKYSIVVPRQPSVAPPAFKAPASPPPPGAAPIQPATPVIAPPESEELWYWIALSSLAVFAIAFILFFVFKH